MANEGSLTRALDSGSLAIIVGLACLSPWAYGSVDAWAEVAIEAAIAVLAALTAAMRFRTGPSASSPSLPGLALLGLAVLAALQATPLYDGLLARVAPANHALRASLVPEVPERVQGDPNPDVAPPPSTVSLDPESTRHAAAQLAVGWVLFECVHARRASYLALRRLGMFIAGNAALLTLFALAQSLTWSGKIYGLRPSPIHSGWLTGGPFVCHNHLAAYLNIGLGLAMGFLLASRSPDGTRVESTSRGWSRQVWAAYASGLIVVGVLASHSRGGFLAMLVSGLVIFFLFRLRAVPLLVVTAPMLVLIAILLVAVGSASPFQRLATILPYATEANIRTEIWRGAFRAWWDHPVVGLGLGTFAVTAAPYFDHDRGVYYTHAENEYLQLLTESGLVGFGLAVMGLFGVARLGLRAMNAAPSSQDRAIMIGSLFSLMALATQSLSDFAPRIPGIGVPALILCASVCRLGQNGARRQRAQESRTALTAWSRIGSGLGGITLVGLSVAILVHGYHRARAEAQVAGAGLPLPETQMPAVTVDFPPELNLDGARSALEQALRERPDWAEGYVRLGMIRLGLYEQATRRRLEERGIDRATSALLADPFWLRGVVLRAKSDPSPGADLFAQDESIRRDLVAAARCFLEARRCSPILALPHARLASLDFLLEPEQKSAHTGRAYRLAGPDSEVLALTARVAAQGGDLGQAARCWRRMLEIGGRLWSQVADQADDVLSPEQILQEVLPPSGGTDALRFADRLFAAPEDEAIRLRFLREALERAPHDPGLAPTERTWLEAQARARLDDRRGAKALMETALALEPLRSDRRREYAAWLFVWRDTDEALGQARIGLHFSPDDPSFVKIQKAAVALFARGTVDRSR